MASISIKINNDGIEASFYDIQSFENGEKLAREFLDRVADAYALSQGGEIVETTNYSYSEEDDDDDIQDAVFTSKYGTETRKLNIDNYNVIDMTIPGFVYSFGDTPVDFTVVQPEAFEDIEEIIEPFIEGGCTFEKTSEYKARLELTRVWNQLDVSKAIARDLTSRYYDVRLMESNITNRNEKRIDFND